MEFSPDGKQLASASADGTVRLWQLDRLPDQTTNEPNSIETNLVLQEHQGPVRHVNFSPSGQPLISSGDDGTVRFWALQRNQAALDDQQSAIDNAPSNVDQKAITISKQDDIFYLVDGQGQPIATFDSDPEVDRLLRTMPALALNNDSQQLASASGNSVYLWNIEKGLITPAPFPPFQEHVGPVSDVAFSTDGRHLASSSENGTIRIQDLNQDLSDGSNSNRSRRNLLPVYGAGITSIDFSPDGNFLVSGDDRGNVQLWNWQKRQGFADWQAHANSAISTVQFSQDSAWVVTTSKDGSTHKWQLKDFDQLHSRGCEMVSDYQRSRQQWQSQNDRGQVLLQSGNQGSKALMLRAKLREIISLFSNASGFREDYDRDRSICGNH